MIRLATARGTYSVLEVVDVAGRRVAVHEIHPGDGGDLEFALDEVGRWPAGLYLVRLVTGDRIATARFMVVH